jgi:hypothetical protein
VELYRPPPYVFTAWHPVNITLIQHTNKTRLSTGPFPSFFQSKLLYIFIISSPVIYVQPSLSLLTLLSYTSLSRSQDSSVVQRWATSWMIGVSSPGRGWKFFSSPPHPDRLCGPPSLLSRGSSLGLKRPGHEGDHSSPSSAEVNNAWSYISTPQYAFNAWCLEKW